MAKSGKILSNCGIDNHLLYQLYSYNLLEALASVNGIGERRLEKIQSQLRNEYADVRISPKINWAYRLVLDVMQEPIEAQNLCEARENGRCLLDQMRDIGEQDICKLHDILRQELRPQLLRVMMRFYRDRSSPWGIAREFGTDPNHIRRIKRKAMARLRQPNVKQSLMQVIFIDDSETSNE